MDETNHENKPKNAFLNDVETKKKKTFFFIHIFFSFRVKNTALTRHMTYDVAQIDTK